MIVRISVLAVLGLLAGFLGGPASAAARLAAATPIAGTEQTTAILVAATNEPHRLAGSDGSDRLEYDLLVANVFNAPVSLTAIDAIASDGGVLLRLEGAALIEATQPLFGQEPTPTIAASGAAAVIMDVVLPHGRAVARLTHRITYALAPNAPARSAIASVTVVEAIDADSGATLVRLSGASLIAAMSLVTLPDTPAVALPPSTVGVVWFDIPLASERDIPAFVAHRVAVAPAPGLPASLSSFTTAPTAVDRPPPVRLGAPLTGAGWAALGSCCDGPHRRSLIPIDGRWRLAQRFAIDFNQLDAENRPGVGDPTLPGSFPTFGQPVLAVADAVVVAAVDRYPDLLVGQAREDLTPESAGGNRVILDLGGGRFAVYAHLQAGSVAVRAGDHVTLGQPIARVGSSGTTGGPHLHFQVTDRPSVLDADGMPYVFAAFTLTGRTPPLADVLPHYDTLQPIPIATTGAGPRRDALPLGRDVVTFPANKR